MFKIHEYTQHDAGEFMLVQQKIHECQYNQLTRVSEKINYSKIEINYSNERYKELEYFV